MNELLKIIEKDIKKTLSTGFKDIEVTKYNRELGEIRFNYKLNNKKNHGLIKYNIYQ